MKEKPNYYSIIPADVRYDKNLRDKAKLLYGEITSLSNKDGYCWASNKYFADLYEVSITTISTLIKELVDNGYIESEIIYKEGTKEIEGRYLKIFKGGYLKKFKEGYLKKFKYNNTSNNNIKYNNNSSSDFLEMVEQEFLNITPLQYEMLIALEEQYGTNNCINALKECAKNNVKNINYLRAVLKNINNIKKNVIKPEWLDKEIEKDEWRLSDEDRQKLGI